MNYELTDETKTDIDGTILYRIRATKDFRDVKKGDIGGWISKSAELLDSAWVYYHAVLKDKAIIRDNVKVKGHAIVKGNATIIDCSIVKDRATVSGNVTISNNATVSGNAIVKDDSRVRDNATVTDNAIVSGHSVINGYSIISDNALIVNTSIPCFREYRYPANPIPSKEDNLIRLGCFVKNRKNWIIEFWDNEEEFSMHSDESKDRLRALNMCLSWYGEDLIKYEDLLH